MATRAIHTVFTVGGENTYRDAVKRINAQIKELNSELELTKERFAGQEDSYTALFTKQQQMERLYEAQNELAGIYANRLKQIQDNTNDLNRYSEELRDTLNQIQAALHTTSETSVGYDELAREARDVEDELRAVETQMGKNATKASELETGINKAQTEMERLSRELQTLDPLVDEAASSVDGLARSMEDTAEGAEKVRDRSSEALDALASSEILDRARDGFREVASAMQDCVDKYVGFESAVTGVEKTVDATDAQLDILAQGIRDMAKDIPATTTEISGVAEAAGQLGIATENILDFTKVMVNLGTTTNMTAEEAADSLARFANITEMDPSNYERLGSTIVDLGNKSASTEEEIVSMGTRLAATGDLVGLSEPEILGMAAALSSLGIEAEAGGTAASKLFKRLEGAVAAYGPALDAVERTGLSLRELELLESNHSMTFKETADAIGLTSSELGKYMDNIKLLDQISEISGTTAERFTQAWGKNAVSALDLFVTGLGKMDESGGNAVQALNEIAGFTEVRLSNAILALASSGGLLTETMETAKTAWDENTALAEEAAKRYKTTESKVQILKNTIEDLEISIGQDFMAAGTPALELLTDIASAAADGAESSPALASGLAGVGGALGGLTALTAAAGGIKLISSALGIFGTMAGPVGAGVAALAGLGAAAAVYAANAGGVTEQAQNLIQRNEELLRSTENTVERYNALDLASEEKQAQVQMLIDKVTGLSDAVNKTPADKAVIQAVVDELNALLPGLGLTFDAQTEKINLTRDAMLEFADASLQAAKVEATRQYIADLTKQQGEMQLQYDLTTMKIRENEEELKNAEKALNEWLEEFRESGGVIALGQEEFHELSDKIAELNRENLYLKDTQKELQEELQNTGEELEAAKIYFNNFGEHVQTTAEKMAQYGKDAVRNFVDGVKEEGWAVRTEGEKLGGDLADGFLAGVEQKESAVGYAATRLARGALDQMAKELDAHSPSRKAKMLGNWFGDGVVLGLEEKGKEVEAAAQRMAGKMNISQTLSRQADEANRQIQKIQNGEGTFSGVPVYMQTKLRMEEISEAMHSVRRDEGFRDAGRVPVQVNIIQELDGREVSRSVSGIQWAENEINIRAAGVTV